MRVAVYAIAKDEATNVRAFMASCADADEVIVLDTGSTDGTPDLLRQAGAIVYEAMIEPWRFDTAKNMALDYVPPDANVCINLDLDERLTPGWREGLERFWVPEAKVITCRMVFAWQDEAQTIPAVVTHHRRIHARHGFIWERPVHEDVVPIDGVGIEAAICQDIWIHHYPSGERDYTKLLDRHLQENPNDATAWLQRATEKLRGLDYDGALQDFHEYFRLTVYATDSQTYYLRSLAWIDVARALRRQERPPEDILRALLYAVAEYPSREAWVYLADAWTSLGNWASAYGAAMNALAITQRGPGASDEICWGDLPKQIASSAFSRIMNRGGN